MQQAEMDSLRVASEKLHESHDKNCVDLAEARNEIDVLTQRLKTSKDETLGARTRVESAELDLARER